MSRFGASFPRFPKLLFASVCTALFVASAFAQDLPPKIRGYAVHKERIIISTPGSDDTKNASPAVAVGDPAVAEVSLSGITFELPLSFTSPGQSGKVDFLTFHDFRVNDIPLSVEDYSMPFEFRKNVQVDLPKPVPFAVNSARLVQAAWKELRDSRKVWTVTGRVFVFGRFRRFGFYHKRVVPVDIRLTIQNPTS